MFLAANRYNSVKLKLSIIARNLKNSLYCGGRITLRIRRLLK